MARLCMGVSYPWYILQDLLVYNDPYFRGCPSLGRSLSDVPLYSILFVLQSKHFFSIMFMMLFCLLIIIMGNLLTIQCIPVMTGRH